MINKPLIIYNEVEKEKLLILTFAQPWLAKARGDKTGVYR
jgi:hypothetical protein